MSTAQTGVKKWPHPHGNNYNTITCVPSKIIFLMEYIMTEHDIFNKEGPYSKMKFQDKKLKKLTVFIQLDIEDRVKLHSNGKANLRDKVCLPIGLQCWLHAIISQARVEGCAQDGHFQNRELGSQRNWLSLKGLQRVAYMSTTDQNVVKFWQHCNYHNVDFGESL